MTVETGKKEIFDSKLLPNQGGLPADKFAENISTHAFNLLKVAASKTKDGVERIIEVEIIGHPSEVAFGYNVVLNCNTCMIDNDIEYAIQKRVSYENQEQDILEDVKIEELKAMEENITELKASRERMIEECVDLGFFARVTKVDGTKSFPKLQMEVAPEIITQLNDLFENMDNYQIQLQPTS